MFCFHGPSCVYELIGTPYISAAQWVLKSLQSTSHPTTLPAPRELHSLGVSGRLGRVARREVRGLRGGHGGLRDALGRGAEPSGAGAMGGGSVRCPGKGERVTGREGPRMSGAILSKSFGDRSAFLFRSSNRVGQTFRRLRRRFGRLRSPQCDNEQARLYR